MRDPQGKIYWLQTRLEELIPAEMKRRAAEPEYFAAMEYAQSTDFYPRD